jgi:quercetin dioxygenase-like cupin family protein
MGHSVKPADLTSPSRNAVRRRLEQEGLRPYSWSNGPGDHYAPHSHLYRKVLYCIEGSIVFHVEGESVNLSPGDRLEIDPDTVHSADVGADGVVCMEAAKD